MRCRGNALGIVIAGLGALIILALILPKRFWLLLIGAALIIVGTAIFKK